jgi:hypothetical protein
VLLILGLGCPFSVFGQESSLTLPPALGHRNQLPRESPAEQFLGVFFENGILSVRARNVTLKALTDTLTDKTGLHISVSPALASQVITGQCTQVDVETGLREILRSAGMTNQVWTYRKNSAHKHTDAWIPERLFIVAAGAGVGQPPPTAGRALHPTSSTPQQARHREHYRDPRTHRVVQVAAREVLVQFTPELSDDEIVRTIEDLGAHVIQKHEQVGLYHLQTPQQQSVAHFIRKHKNHPGLLLLEPNPVVAIPPAKMVPNDPLFWTQWALARIAAPQAWAITTGSQDIIVAVLDTGINPNHPELQGKSIPGRNLIEQNHNAEDDHGHGTAIAGIIAAATDNGIGMAGVCGSCRVMPVKVLDAQGEGTYADVIAGILWAVDNGAQILNLSLGEYVYSRLLAATVAYAQARGAILVAAAGNEAANEPLYPAAFPHVIGVAATDVSDHIWVASHYGAHVDLAAPGVNILSTGLSDGYVVASGTSFSAAYVSGVAALVRSHYRHLSNTHIEHLLYYTADDLGVAGRDEVYGFGRINAAQALRMEP